ncbi:MAG: BatD family protein [Gammaproteobacteria bacterium]|nr:BatD family protein [Gammaproteobacteria bacterium]
MSRTRTKRICIICLLATFISGVTQTAAGFSFGTSNPSKKDPRITTNRPWGNLDTPKPALKYEPPPATPGSRYLGAGPGAGWYAAQVPGVGNPSHGGQPVVEVETSRAVFYEQQNIVYTVRVVSSDNLKTLNPVIPRIEGAILEQVDGPVASTRKSRRNSAREIINEYHFKLTPLRSGEIVIPAIRFTGTHVSGRQWNGAPGMPVSATENSFSIASDSPLKFQVLPADPAVKPWLPLNDLKLRMHMPDDGPVKAGVPVTLTLELTARGALGAQLPSLEQQLKNNGFRAYRDSVTTSNGISRDGTQLLGSRKETYTIIPTQDGRVQLPGIQVAWWDVETGMAMLAGLPGQNAVASAAGNSHAAVATGEQEFVSGYFWASMLIIMGLIVGFWLGAWARTLPSVHSAGTRAGTWLSATGRRVVQNTVTASKKFSPMPYLDRFRLGLAFIMPRTVKLWLCIRCIERESSPEAWCAQLRSRICRDLEISRHAPITAIAEKIIEVQPLAEPARLRSLVQSLDHAIYGAGPLDFAAWKKDFRNQLRPRLYRGRRSRLRRARRVLPALNPHTA